MDNLGVDFNLKFDSGSLSKLDNLFKKIGQIDKAIKALSSIKVGVNTSSLDKLEKVTSKINSVATRSAGKTRGGGVSGSIGGYGDLTRAESMLLQRSGVYERRTGNARRVGAMRADVRSMQEEGGIKNYYDKVQRRSTNARAVNNEKALIRDKQNAMYLENKEVLKSHSIMKEKAKIQQKSLEVERYGLQQKVQQTGFLGRLGMASKGQLSTENFRAGVFSGEVVAKSGGAAGMKAKGAAASGKGQGIFGGRYANNLRTSVGLGYYSLAGSLGGGIGTGFAGLGGILGGLAGAPGVGLAIGSGVGAVVGGASRAVQAQYGLIQDVLGPTAQKHKNMRRLSTVAGEDFGRNPNEMLKYAREIENIAIQQGAGTINEYMDVAIDALGKGMKKGAVDTFMKVTGNIATDSGTSIQQAAGAFMPLVLGSSKLFEQAGILKRTATGGIESFDEKKLQNQANIMLALTSAGGVEVQDLPGIMGQLTSRGSIGGMAPMEMLAYTEAISGSVPKAREAATMISNLAMKGGDVKLQGDYIALLKKQKGKGKIASTLEAKKAKNEISMMDVLGAVEQSVDVDMKTGKAKKGYTKAALIKEELSEKYGVKEIRAGAGAAMSLDSAAQLAEMQRIVKTAYMPRYESGFKLDQSMMQLENFWTQRKTDYGNVMAPFVSAGINELIGTTKGGVDWGNIANNTRASIDAEYADSPEIRDSLNNFVNILEENAGKVTQVFNDLVSNMPSIVDALIQTFAMLDSAIIGLVDGLIKIGLMKEENLSPEQQWKRKYNKGEMYQVHELVNESEKKYGLYAKENIEAANAFKEFEGPNKNWGGEIKYNDVTPEQRKKIDEYVMSGKLIAKEGFLPGEGLRIVPNIRGAEGGPLKDKKVNPVSGLEINGELSPDESVKSVLDYAKNAELLKINRQKGMEMYMGRLGENFNDEKSWIRQDPNFQKAFEAGDASLLTYEKSGKNKQEDLEKYKKDPTLLATMEEERKRKSLGELGDSVPAPAKPSLFLAQQPPNAGALQPMGPPSPAISLAPMGPPSPTTSLAPMGPPSPISNMAFTPQQAPSMPSVPSAPAGGLDVEKITQAADTAGASIATSGDTFSTKVTESSASFSDTIAGITEQLSGIASQLAAAVIGVNINVQGSGTTGSAVSSTDRLHVAYRSNDFISS